MIIDYFSCIMKSSTASSPQMRRKRYNHHHYRAKSRFLIHL
ncbi:hypothetical protein EVA_20896 [gut metagenome]|uniref:Uncharacterized protein n=1 Tax=gut metagenome TaxID=749906 RepID=J9F986_9ZZZZ